MKASIMLVALLLSGCATTQLITHRHEPTRGGVYATPHNVVFPWHAAKVRDSREAIISGVCGSGERERVDYSHTMLDAYGHAQTYTHFTCEKGTP